MTLAAPAPYHNLILTGHMGMGRNTVGRLCIDPSGRIIEPCTRDGVKESYLTPAEHPVIVAEIRSRVCRCGVWTGFGSDPD